MPAQDIGKGNNRADRIHITSDRMQFKFLLDTPDAYNGYAGEVVMVNFNEKEVVFVPISQLNIHAKDVIFDPEAGITSTNVQDAIVEVALHSSFVTNVVTINPGENKDVDIIPATDQFTVKWIMIIEDDTGSKYYSAEILCLFKDPSISYSRYSILGDKILHDLNIILSGGYVNFQIRNNELNTIKVSLLRLPTI